jgi:hypothetical protein
MHKTHKIPDILECAEHGPGWCPVHHGEIECQWCFATGDALLRACKHQPVPVSQQARARVLKNWQDV